MSKFHYSQFKNVAVGAEFECGGTQYIKINGRMGQINMPEKEYHGNKFYFGYSELCKLTIEG